MNEIRPGHHPTFSLFGLTFNTDTLLSTLVAASIVVGLGLYVARRAAARRPSKPQLLFEMLVEWVHGQLRDNLGLRVPRGVPELCITLFAFILIANWMAALPTEHYLPPPTRDVNLVYPMALFVIVWVNAVGIRRRGLRGYFAHFAKPYPALAPIELVTHYFARPVSLALRLFGNIFAGGVMIQVIGQLPALALWLPNVAWKLFEMFVGIIQALIFTLLTIIYFSEAVEEHQPTQAELRS